VDVRVRDSLACGLSDIQANIVAIGLSFAGETPLHLEENVKHCGPLLISE